LKKILQRDKADRLYAVTVLERVESGKQFIMELLEPIGYQPTIAERPGQGGRTWTDARLPGKDAVQKNTTVYALKDTGRHFLQSLYNTSDEWKTFANEHHCD
jgi:hypothetical protein